MSRQRIAALYPRTSKDKDDAFSIQSQLTELHAYAQENGFIVPSEYIFPEDHTGKVIDRPELNRLRRVMREGLVDALIVYDATRLARKVGVAEYILDEVFELGIELHLVSWGTCVKDSPRDVKMFYDEAVYSHIERMKIMERLERGKRQKLAQGIWLGQGINKYGYGKTGTKRNTQLHIVEEEAAVIRLIFDLFVRQRVSVMEIAQHLQQMGYPTPSQAKSFWKPRPVWSEHMVYSILREDKYTGLFYPNLHVQQESKKTPGKKSTIKRDKDTLEGMVFPELRIISDDIFATAQKLLDEGRSRWAPNPTNEYLMARRGVCVCGHAIQSSTTKTPYGRYQYYVCNSRKMGKRRAEICDLPNVSVTQVDRIVWEWVEDLLNDPEAVLVGHQRIQQAQQKNHTEIMQDRETILARIARAEEELDRYQEMYAHNLMTLDKLKVKKQELDRVIANAEAILSEYDDVLKVRVLSDKEIAQRVQAIRELKKEIDQAEKDENGELLFKHKRKLIEILNIEMKLGTEDGRVYIEIIWHGLVQDSFWVELQNSAPSTGRTAGSGSGR